MIITPVFLSQVARKPVNPNMFSVLDGLMEAPASLGLDRPVRLSRYLGQTCHESMGWTYDREIWGNTPAQIRYDTRTDLGNTAARDGDGFLYRGRTGIQVTGRANYAAFRDWCRAAGLSPPDFVAAPDATLTDPWEGLGPVWYWATHRHLGQSLNELCDIGDDDAVTQAVNGGTNGLQDRITCTIRAGLALLGMASVTQFQLSCSLTPDGIAGPITRGVLHKSLVALPPVSFALS